MSTNTLRTHLTTPFALSVGTNVPESKSERLRVFGMADILQALALLLASITIIADRRASILLKTTP